MLDRARKPSRTVPLFVSPVQPIGGASPNVYSWDKRPAAVRIAMSFLNHPGLSFLRANVPCRILEYPDADAYRSALADRPEIVGISFYINETEIALEMAEQARQAGARQVWAGNYGAYSPQVSRQFDRTFTGWGEQPVAAALGVSPPEGIVHPEIYGAIGTPLLPWMVFSGLLFTSRGCPFTCSFCQTPDFYGSATRVPLASIDRVLWQYRRSGVRGINILDENFGTFPGHAREVVRMLHKHGMRWIALTRVDTLLRNFDDWAAHGLFGAHLGIESLNQDSLSGATKRLSQLDTIRLLRKMSQRNMFVQCFYIIGFEEDTVESVERDIEVLATLDVDVVQVQVLTPYPRTRQSADARERFGIDDANLSKYNSRNLVWRHPNIRPDEMRRLQECANRQLISSRRALRTLAKFGLYHGRERVNTDGLRTLWHAFAGRTRGLHARYAPRVAAARSWADTGWYAYEEFDSETSATRRGHVTPLPSATLGVESAP